MKTLCAYLEGARNLKMIERNLELAEDEVLVKVIQASICDADLRAYRGMDMPSDLPPFMYLGHEGGGEVVEIGSKVREFKIGDKVMLFGPHSSYADYFKAKVDDLHKVPRGCDIKAACLGEPLSVGMYGVVETGVQLGDTVAVIGLNFQGLLGVQALKKRGAGTVIAIDYSNKHLKIAEETGADVVINTRKEKDVLEYIKDITDGHLCDIALHSCGYWNPFYEEYFNLGKEIVRDEGTIVSVPDIMSPLKTCLHRIHHHAQEIKFAAVMHHGTDFRKIWVPRLMRMIEKGGIDVNPLITGTYKISDAPEAMKEFDENEDHVKIILES